MILCVAIISLQSFKSNTKSGTNTEALEAIGYGLLASLLVAVSIAIGRYWTLECGYKSFDFTIDSFLVMSISEIGLFIHYELYPGYSDK